MLDEPTNHLDPQHQLHVLGLFRALADKGAAVIATLHDPTLAARFADRVILLFGDGRWRAGPTREMLTAERLTELYLTPMIEIDADGRRVFAQRVSVSRTAACNAPLVAASTVVVASPTGLSLPDP